jgi:hypothetical protein
MKYQINPKYNCDESLAVEIEWLFENSSIVLQDARNKIKQVSYNDADYVVKSFKRPTILRAIFYTLFRRSKAQRSYDYSLKIANFVPRALGFVEFYQHKLLTKSYFISELFAYDFTVREALIDLTFANREKVFRSFAKFSFELHQQGILHKDFSPGNILIKRQGTEFEFKVIDINRMSFGVLSTPQRMKNFSMLWASDADLDRIVTEYALLANLDLAMCLAMANRYNQRNKRFKNFKKPLKGRPVTD